MIPSSRQVGIVAGMRMRRKFSLGIKELSASLPVISSNSQHPPQMPHILRRCNGVGALNHRLDLHHLSLREIFPSRRPNHHHRRDKCTPPRRHLSWTGLVPLSLGLILANGITTTRRVRALATQSLPGEETPTSNPRVPGPMNLISNNQSARRK